MVAWDKAKGKKAANSGGDRREIKRLTLKMGDNKVRLVGEVLPRYVYWVPTKEGKNSPVECLRFDRKTETFNNNADDPLAELDEDVYNDKPSFAYVCNIIDRADDEVKLFDLRSTIYAQIVDYATNNDYGSPADPDNGYDITIKKEKTGPLPQNVKYTVIPARNNSALTDEEKELELYDLETIVKRPDYATQKQWLLDNTDLFNDGVGDEFKSSEEVEDLA